MHETGQATVGEWGAKERTYTHSLKPSAVHRQNDMLAMAILPAALTAVAGELETIRPWRRMNRSRL